MPGDGSPRLQLEPVAPPERPGGPATAARRVPRRPGGLRRVPPPDRGRPPRGQGRPAQPAVDRAHHPGRPATAPTPSRSTPDDAKDVAAALTDLRLVLAERLEIRTDGQAERLYDQLLTSPAAELDDVASDAARSRDPALPGRRLRGAELAAGVARRGAARGPARPGWRDATPRPAGPRPVSGRRAVRLDRVNDAPLGIFDSGVGGLTVARSILDQLPHESTIYIGDTLNTPYGSKPLAAVRAHALEVMDDLVDAGVKLLVIACNTASSAMLRDARERYTLRRGIPVVEVILPAARRAVAATRTGRIGVIATKSTVESKSYDDAFAVAPGVAADHAGLPAVRRAGRGGHHLRTGGPRAGARVPGPGPGRGRRHPRARLHALPAAHRARSPTSWVRTSRSSPAPRRPPRTCTARSSRTTWSATRDAGPPSHRFLATGDPAAFQSLARRFLGPEVESVETARRAAMRLTILGCAGSFPSADSAASGYLVQAEDADGRTWSVLLDLGNGALGALQRYGDPTAARRDRPVPPARRPRGRPRGAARAAQVRPVRCAPAGAGLRAGRARRTASSSCAARSTRASSST